jgi:hypothetical protein
VGTDTDLPISASFNRRVEDESVHAYQMFCTFRDMGDKRSVKDVAKAHDVSTSYVYDLSSKNKWASRIAAYTEWLENQRMKRVARINAKIAAMEVAAQMRATKILVKLYERLLQRIESEPKFLLMPQELAIFADLVTKVSRVGRGDAAMIGEMKGANPQDELISTLKQLAGKKSANQKTMDEIVKDSTSSTDQ